MVKLVNVGLATLHLRAAVVLCICCSSSKLCFKVHFWSRRRMSRLFHTTMCRKMEDNTGGKILVCLSTYKMFNISFLHYTYIEVFTVDDMHANFKAAEVNIGNNLINKRVFL